MNPNTQSPFKILEEFGGMSVGETGGGDTDQTDNLSEGDLFYSTQVFYRCNSPDRPKTMVDVYQIGSGKKQDPLPHQDQDDVDDSDYEVQIGVRRDDPPPEEVFDNPAELLKELGDLKDLAFTREQIIRFVRENVKFLQTLDWVTVMLFDGLEGITAIRFDYDSESTISPTGLYARWCEVDRDDGLWMALVPYRIVVPKKTLPS